MLACIYKLSITSTFYFSENSKFWPPRCFKQPMLLPGWLAQGVNSERHGSRLEHSSYLIGPFYCLSSTLLVVRVFNPFLSTSCVYIGETKSVCFSPHRKIFTGLLNSLKFLLAIKFYSTALTADHKGFP